jgi:segregation and condensation protein A
MKAFKRVVTRMEERESRPIHTIVKYHFTIKDQKSYLLTCLKKKEKIAFEDAFAQLDNRVHAVFTFLALLELIQEKFLKISLGMGKNNFWLIRG